MKFTTHVVQLSIMDSNIEEGKVWLLDHSGTAIAKDISSSDQQ